MGICLFLGLGLVEALHDAPTFDEPVYQSSGALALLHHDLVINDEHPPLPKVLAALPMLAAQPIVPPGGRWDRNDERTYSARWVRAQVRDGRMRRVTFLSRLVPLLEAAAVALAIAALAEALFENKLGTHLGLLWLASPLVLGIGHLDGVDIPFALAAVLMARAILAWSRRPRSGRAVLCGLAGAGVVCSSVLGLLLVGLAAGVMAVRGPQGRQRVLPVATLLVTVWLATWAFYVVLDPTVVVHGPGVLPGPYLDGLRFLSDHDRQAAPGYLMGHAYLGGRWWYWPTSLVAKEPWVTLVALSAGALSWTRLARHRLGEAVAVVGLPAGMLAGFYLLSPRDIGVRYLLPALALGLAGAGALAPSSRRRPDRSTGGKAGDRARRPPWSFAGLSLAVLVSAALTVGSAPNSLAWSTAAFRPAYANLSDSNVDWGQALYDLQTWSRGKSARTAYFGPRGLDVGAGTLPLIGVPPDRIRGWVAASATALNTADRSRLDWLRAYCPVRVLDGAVLIYRFRSPPEPSARGKTSSPLPRTCPGRFSLRS